MARARTARRAAAGIDGSVPKGRHRAPLLLDDHEVRHAARRDDRRAADRVCVPRGRGDGGGVSGAGGGAGGARLIGWRFVGRRLASGRAATSTVDCSGALGVSRGGAEAAENCSLGRATRRRARLLPSATPDRKSTRLNSSHSQISYAVFCLKKKKKTTE